MAFAPVTLKEEDDDAADMLLDAVGEDEVEKMAKEACHDLEVYMWLHELKKL
jgi:hypothetical protein